MWYVFAEGLWWSSENMKSHEKIIWASYVSLWFGEFEILASFLPYIRKLNIFHRPDKMGFGW